MRDAAFAQDLVNWGRPKHAFSGLVDDELTGNGCASRDNVCARFSLHEDAAHRPFVADLEARLATPQLGWRTVGQIRRVTFSCVENGPAPLAKNPKQRLHCGNDGFEARHFVAERLAETAALDKIALHV